MDQAGQGSPSSADVDNNSPDSNSSHSDENSNTESGTNSGHSDLNFDETVPESLENLASHNRIPQGDPENDQADQSSGSVPDSSGSIAQAAEEILQAQGSGSESEESEMTISETRSETSEADAPDDTDSDVAEDNNSAIQQLDSSNNNSISLQGTNMRRSIRCSSPIPYNVNNIVAVYQTHPNYVKYGSPEELETYLSHEHQCRPFDSLREEKHTGIIFNTQQIIRPTVQGEFNCPGEFQKLTRKGKNRRVSRCQSVNGIFYSKEYHRPEFNRSEIEFALQIQPGISEPLGLTWNQYIVKVFMREKRGQTLSEILLKRRKISDQELHWINYCILCQLRNFHQAGIIYRNLDPDHVIICRQSGTLGFVSARTLCRWDERFKIDGTFYSSPEVIQDSNLVDFTRGACDVYSIGALLHRCITRTHPFFGEVREQQSQTRLLFDIAGGQRSIQSYLSGLGNPWRDMISRMTLFDANRRASINDILHMYYEVPPRWQADFFATTTCPVNTYPLSPNRQDQIIHSSGRRIDNSDNENLVPSPIPADLAQFRIEHRIMNNDTDYLPAASPVPGPNIPSDEILDTEFTMENQAEEAVGDEVPEVNALEPVPAKARSAHTFDSGLATTNLNSCWQDSEPSLAIPVSTEGQAPTSDSTIQSPMQTLQRKSSLDVHRNPETPREDLTLSRSVSMEVQTSPKNPERREFILEPASSSSIPRPESPDQHQPLVGTGGSVRPGQRDEARTFPGACGRSLDSLDPHQTLNMKHRSLPAPALLDDRPFLVHVVSILENARIQLTLVIQRSKTGKDLYMKIVQKMKTKGIVLTYAGNIIQFETALQDIFQNREVGITMERLPAPGLSKPLQFKTDVDSKNMSVVTTHDESISASDPLTSEQSEQSEWVETSELTQNRHTIGVCSTATDDEKEEQEEEPGSQREQGDSDDNHDTHLTLSEDAENENGLPSDITNSTDSTVVERSMNDEVSKEESQLDDSVNEEEFSDTAQAEDNPECSPKASVHFTTQENYDLDESNSGDEGENCESDAGHSASSDDDEEEDEQSFNLDESDHDDIQTVLDDPHQVEAQGSAELEIDSNVGSNLGRYSDSANFESGPTEDGEDGPEGREDGPEGREDDGPEEREDDTEDKEDDPEGREDGPEEREDDTEDKEDDPEGREEELEDPDESTLADDSGIAAGDVDTTESSFSDANMMSPLSDRGSFHEDFC